MDWNILTNNSPPPAQQLRACQGGGVGWISWTTRGWTYVLRTIHLQSVREVICTYIPVSFCRNGPDGLDGLLPSRASIRYCQVSTFETTPQIGSKLPSSNPELAGEQATGGIGGEEKHA